MNKRILFVLLLSAILLVSAYAQNVPTPQYVNIDDARAEMNRLTDENRQMAEMNERLAQENMSLERQIGGSTRFIAEVDEMIARIVSAKGTIYTAIQTVNENDSATRRDLQDKMNELRESEYELEKSKRQEYTTINQTQELMNTNRRQIAVNNVRTEKNEQRIAYLGSCIDMTENENRDVDELMANADEVRREVEALLSRP